MGWACRKSPTEGQRRKSWDECRPCSLNLCIILPSINIAYPISKPLQILISQASITADFFNRPGMLGPWAEQFYSSNIERWRSWVRLLFSRGLHQRPGRRVGVASALPRASTRCSK